MRRTERPTMPIANKPMSEIVRPAANDIAHRETNAYTWDSTVHRSRAATIPMPIGW